VYCLVAVGNSRVATCTGSKNLGSGDELPGIAIVVELSLLEADILLSAHIVTMD